MTDADYVSKLIEKFNSVFITSDTNSDSLDRIKVNVLKNRTGSIPKSPSMT